MIGVMGLACLMSSVLLPRIFTILENFHAELADKFCFGLMRDTLRSKWYSTEGFGYSSDRRHVNTYETDTPVLGTNNEVRLFY
jgi:hypothetical protein